MGGNVGTWSESRVWSQGRQCRFGGDRSELKRDPGRIFSTKAIAFRKGRVGVAPEWTHMDLVFRIALITLMILFSAPMFLAGDIDLDDGALDNTRTKRAPLPLDHGDKTEDA